MRYKPVEIGKGVFWIGTPALAGGLSVNIYLLIDRFEPLLIGCGPASEFDQMYSSLIEIVEVRYLKYIVLHNSDPSICSAAMLFEKEGFNGKIISHQANIPHIGYYGLKSEILVSGDKLLLKAGRRLDFIEITGSHGNSLSTYDEKTGIYFSGTLFSSSHLKWKLFRGVENFSGIKKYNDLSGNEDYIIRRGIDNLDNRKVNIIAPQYGSLIKEGTDTLSTYSDYFRKSEDVERRRAAQKSEIVLLNRMLGKLHLLCSRKELIDIFEESGLIINNDTGLLHGYEKRVEDPWNHFFNTIYTRKGYRWISILEKEIRLLSAEERIRKPDVISTLIYDMDRNYGEVEKEKSGIEDNLRELEIKAESILAKDPLAQVYKEDIFRENLVEDVALYRNPGIDFAFFILEVDRLNQLNVKYGRDAGDEILANAAYLLKNFKMSQRDYVHHLIFRMNGPRFVYYGNDVSRNEIIKIAEEVRREFRESRIFITDITVSIGVVHSEEFRGIDKSPVELSEDVIEIASSRLRLAKHGGSDSICVESETSYCIEKESYIVVIDPDAGVRHMLQASLGDAGYKVVAFSTGSDALERIDTDPPSLIISEALMPKLDGFTLRRKLMEDSSLKDIPFILTSFFKDDTSITRAQSMGIFYYFKKPYSLTELKGLIKNIMNENE